MSRRGLVGLTYAVLLVLTASTSALAVVATEQVSVNRRGGDAGGLSFRPSISADGRYVAFHSSARDLVEGDGSGFFDVFVRDMVTGAIVRASVDTGGGDPNRDSCCSSISANGQDVAFSSDAPDLVPDDGNGFSDVFVRDLVGGTTTRVSVDTGGGDPKEESFAPSISADGRYVAFWSYASDLVPGDDFHTDVFVRDLLAGTTTRASLDTEGRSPNNSSWAPSISADGRYVAFQSSASDLVPGDGNDETDVFVRDLLAGTTLRASVDTEEGDPDDDSSAPSISADGRYVAFSSEASDLVRGDRNGRTDVFVRDLVDATTTRASSDAGRRDSNGDSYDPSISADGRYIAFWSSASDLVEWDINGFTDVFVRDLMTRTTSRVSVDTGGPEFQRRQRITQHERRWSVRGLQVIRQRLGA